MSVEIEFETQGQLGIITLNRPTALNALNLSMIHAMQHQLSLWKEDFRIKAVVIRAAAGKAFCAGGDVRWIYQMGREGNPQQMAFFLYEYRLNHFIHSLGKPYIALMDGLTMGGGVGISLHGGHPVASERFVFAMPETGIGFFPDIGASYLLTRCPGALGLYLGLTGQRLGPQEALQAGLIKQILPSESMSAFVETLAKEDLSTHADARVNECLASFVNPDLSRTSEINPLIDHCFTASTVAAIMQALEADGSVWALETLAVLAKKSPLSLKVTQKQLQQACGLSLAECLAMDFHLANRFMRGSDFYEGVRALLIDKDNNPAWRPQHLEDVLPEQVNAYFQEENSHTCTHSLAV